MPRCINGAISSRTSSSGSRSSGASPPAMTKPTPASPAPSISSAPISPYDECLQTLERAKSGYRFLNLDGIADLLSEAKTASIADDDMNQWDVELDRRYHAIVPTDATLAAHFEMIFRDRPAEFAPI